MTKLKLLNFEQNKGKCNHFCFHGFQHFPLELFFHFYRLHLLRILPIYSWTELYFSVAISSWRWQSSALSINSNAHHRKKESIVKHRNVHIKIKAWIENLLWRILLQKILSQISWIYQLSINKKQCSSRPLFSIAQCCMLI